ncbi:hypothetical protein, partial [Candidatus Halobonum tyrrellensis]
ADAVGGDDLPDDLSDKPRYLADLLADEWSAVDGPGVTITEAHEAVQDDRGDDAPTRRTVGNWITELEGAGVLEQVADDSKPGNVYAPARND